jgi:hypothetical protein
MDASPQASKVQTAGSLLGGCLGHLGRALGRRCGGQFFNGLFGTWDQATNPRPDISLAEYKPVIKLSVAATAGCQGTKN